MNYRGLKARIALLAARIPCASKVRPVLISYWNAVVGKRAVRLPDAPLHDEPQAARPSVFVPGKRGQRPVGQRQLAAIRVVYVDAATATPEGHSFEQAPAPDAEEASA